MSRLVMRPKIVDCWRGAIGANPQPTPPDARTARFRVLGLRFRVEDSGFRVKGAGYDLCAMQEV